jgi:hypothetical protein
VEYLTPLQAYTKLAKQFIGETRALLTQPHGLLDQRIILDQYQREALRHLIAEARLALDQLMLDVDQTIYQAVDESAVQPLTPAQFDALDEGPTLRDFVDDDGDQTHHDGNEDAA